MRWESLDARRSELRRIPIRSHFVCLPQQESTEAAMMGAAVGGLSPQLLSSHLPTSRRILFNLQPQSPSCAAACKAQATSSSPFTAPASGVSTFSHVNPIAWVWCSMVSLSSVYHYQDLLMGLPHITRAYNFTRLPRWRHLDSCMCLTWYLPRHTSLQLRELRWYDMVSLSSLCHHRQDLLMGLPQITCACKFGG